MWRQKDRIRLALVSWEWFTLASELYGATSRINVSNKHPLSEVRSHMLSRYCLLKHINAISATTSAGNIINGDRELARNNTQNAPFHRMAYAHLETLEIHLKSTPSHIFRCFQEIVSNLSPKGLLHFTFTSSDESLTVNEVLYNVSPITPALASLSIYSRAVDLDILADFILNRAATLTVLTLFLLKEESLQILFFNEILASSVLARNLTSIKLHTVPNDFPWHLLNSFEALKRIDIKISTGVTLQQAFLDFFRDNDTVTDYCNAFLQLNESMLPLLSTKNRLTKLSVLVDNVRFGLGSNITFSHKLTTLFVDFATLRHYAMAENLLLNLHDHPTITRLSLYTYPGDINHISYLIRSSHSLQHLTFLMAPCSSVSEHDTGVQQELYIFYQVLATNHHLCQLAFNNTHSDTQIRLLEFALIQNKQLQKVTVNYANNTPKHHPDITPIYKTKVIPLHSGDFSGTSNNNADFGHPLMVVVVGASGDLAKKKTYPALFGLFCRDLLPHETRIYGYARSHIELEEFKKKIASHLKGDEEKKKMFLELCKYHNGAYDTKESYDKFDQLLCQEEKTFKDTHINRLFYMAIPPSIFLDVAKGIKDSLISKTGWSRVIVEKPFGKDLTSSRHLISELKKLYLEKDLFRIDHYLGKEMVQNLMVLRFANAVFEPLWSKAHIASISITFKEDIGTEGRGGYFDQFGIIRDVMQNHLLQVLSLVAMEPPVSMHADDITNEKVKLLRCIQPIKLDELVLGQFVGDKNGKNPGYLDDEGVPKDSKTPTYAAAIFHVNNPRWRGMPFILKCGKALDQRKTEIRIQFKRPENFLFKDEDISRNELVMRIQPGEAVYMKLLTKKPGLNNTIEQTELDLSYRSRFENLDLPDAYERLILDSIKGDHNLFVRDDELDVAWQIFTPLLEAIEKDNLTPDKYEFGSRGPQAADELLKRAGYIRSTGYKWPGHSKI
eukprot:gene10891-12693_t